jgi:hypothetical protein
MSTCRHRRAQLLGERGARLGLSTPRQFFWVTGALSSFLDNTPTYVALSAAASSLLGTDPQVPRLKARVGAKVGIREETIKVWVRVTVTSQRTCKPRAVCLCQKLHETASSSFRAMLTVCSAPPGASQFTVPAKACPEREAAHKGQSAEQAVRIERCLRSAHMK